MLFSLGLVGAGMLGVPVLAGSSAYAITEAAVWPGSLADRPGIAPRFYSVIAVGLAPGLALDYAGINPVAMLFWSAVVNGVLAPPLIVIVLLLVTAGLVFALGTRPKKPVTPATARVVAPPMPTTPIDLSKDVNP